MMSQTHKQLYIDMSITWAVEPVFLSISACFHSVHFAAHPLIIILRSPLIPFKLGSPMYRFSLLLPKKWNFAGDNTGVSKFHRSSNQHSHVSQPQRYYRYVSNLHDMHISWLSRWYIAWVDKIFKMIYTCFWKSFIIFLYTRWVGAEIRFINIDMRGMHAHFHSIKSY